MTWGHPERGGDSRHVQDQLKLDGEFVVLQDGSFGLFFRALLALWALKKELGNSSIHGFSWSRFTFGLGSFFILMNLFDVSAGPICGCDR